MTKTRLLTTGIAIFIFLTVVLSGVLWFTLAAPETSIKDEVNTMPSAVLSEIVELKNGDTYNLSAGFVLKKLGNRSYRMLAYNGSIPGPLIKVKQGSEVTINFMNNTDVDSTIHSHGVRVENQFDSVLEVTQNPVKPGESFTYQLKFPDPGVYWYHPHIREDYAQELGLYGNFLVEPNNPSYWNPVNQEAILMLDDILMENGTIARFNPETADHTLMGRFGNVMLVNGETDYRIDAKQSEVIRFYFTNTANARTFNVSIPDVKMKLVGNDNGKYERETFVGSIILGPSERAIVEILFDNPGTYQLEHRTSKKTYPLATITVSSGHTTPSYALAFQTLGTNQEVMAGIDRLRADFDKPADKSLQLAVAMKSPMGTPARQSPGSGGMSNGSGQHLMAGGMMMDNQIMGMNMGGSEPIEWEDDMGTMNRNSTKDTLTWQLVDEQTGRANTKIDDWKFKIGDVVKIKVFNDPKSMHPMQHPIHIHGQRFLVLSTNGVKSDNFVWKDTALIKTGDTVEFLVEMGNPGDWMIHCHISEHLEAGMMMKFEVE